MPCCGELAFPWPASKWASRTGAAGLSAFSLARGGAARGGATQAAQDSAQKRFGFFGGPSVEPPRSGGRSRPDE
eukprot:6958827-Pyramimonas_sp.AAC.1